MRPLYATGPQVLQGFPGPLCIEGGVPRFAWAIVTYRTRHPGRSIRPRLLSRPATGSAQPQRPPSSSDPMPFPSRPRVARFPAAVAGAILGNLPQLPAVSRPTILAVLYRRLGPGNLTVPAPRRARHHFIRSHARELHIVQSLGFLSGRFPGGHTVTLTDSAEALVAVLIEPMGLHEKAPQKRGSGLNRKVAL